MLSNIIKDRNQKKSKEAQRHEEYQTACNKVDGFYYDLHLTNCELKDISDHDSIITYPKQRQRNIICDINLLQEQISHIISTVNKLEDDDSRPTKLEFDKNLALKIEQNFTNIESLSSN